MSIQIRLFEFNSIPGAPAEMSDYYLVLYDFQVRNYLRPDLKYNPAWDALGMDIYHEGERGFSVPRSLVDPHDGQVDKIGYPSTVRLISESGKGTPWGEILQWYDFDLCLLTQFGFTFDSLGWSRLAKDLKKKVVNEWTSFHNSRKVLNNNAGVDERANYPAAKILGEPLKSGMPLQFNIVMSGNIVKAKSNAPVLKAGTSCIEIEIWDGKTPAPTIDFSIDHYPHLVHWCTNSSPFDLDGKTIHNPPKPPWRVDAFGYFGGKGSPYTLLNHEPQWIRLDRVKRLSIPELNAWLVHRKPYYP